MTVVERIKHFLLVFDHKQGRLIETLTFGRDADADVAAYAVKEAEYGDRKFIRGRSSSVPTRSRRSS
jgi:hypothetical protein